MVKSIQSKPADLQAILLVRDKTTGKTMAIGAEHIDAIPGMRKNKDQKTFHKVITLTMEDVRMVSIEDKKKWLNGEKQMTNEELAMCLYLYKLSYNAANKTKPSKRDDNNEQ